MTAYTMALLLAIFWAWSSAISRWTSGRPILPEATAVRPPFGILSALGVCVLYLVVTGLITRASGLKAGGDPKDLPVDTLLIITTATNAAILAAAPLFLLGTSRARLADLGIPGRDPLGDLGRGARMILLVLPAVILIGVAVNSIWPHTEGNEHPLETLVTQSMTPRSVVLALLAGVIFAPLAEELLFRGIFLPALMRPIPPRRADAPDAGDPPLAAEAPQIPPGEEPETWAGGSPLDEPYAPPKAASNFNRRGPQEVGPPGRAFWAANIFTSLFFALLHGPQWPAPIPLFAFSLALGWARWRTGGLVAPIVMHMLFNLNSTILLAFSLKTVAE